MNNFDPIAYKEMVKSHQKSVDILGWFDTIYTDAKGDYKSVFWADLAPSPYLLEWLQNNETNANAKRAIVVGCGVGDDAEALSDFGYEVTAFDISPEAIKLCKGRYPQTKVEYIVENLFDYPKEWQDNFDLVYECNTIQVLPNEHRINARDAMVEFLKKDGYILVSCRSRNEGKQLDDIPLPLDKDEMDGFIKCGLSEESFLAYDDEQTPSVPHFFGVYKK